MQTPIRLGVIGAGDIALNAHIPVLSCMDDVRVTYTADIKQPELTYPKNTKKIKISDISSIPDCDILLISTPVGVRESYLKEFSKRNIPILSEKPFARNLETHKRFLEISKRITCNYMRTHYNTVRQLQSIIQKNLFGELKSINITEGGIVGKTQKGKGHYQTDPRLSCGGILMEFGSHTLSQLHQMLPTHKINLQKAKAVYQKNIDVDVITNMVASKNRKSIDIKYHTTLIKPLQTLSTYNFENAKINFNHVDPSSPLNISLTGKKENFILKEDNRWATTFFQAFYLKWRDFIEKIKNNQQIDTTKETSLNTTKIITITIINNNITSAGRIVPNMAFPQSSL